MNVGPVEYQVVCRVDIHIFHAGCRGVFPSSRDVVDVTLLTDVRTEFCNQDLVFHRDNIYVYCELRNALPWCRLSTMQ